MSRSGLVDALTAHYGSPGRHSSIATVLTSRGRCTECRSLSTAGTTVLSRSGLVDALTTHYGSPGRLADYRRQFERTTRTIGEDPAIFVTALETLAVKAFGDMGQTARLRLIRDRFIAGHSNCDLRRHLDSVSPETPIRDVVDRCRVWGSHADPAVRRMGKPSPDPTYAAYAVGDTDSYNEVTRVAAVTGLRSGPESVRGLAPAGNFDRGASGSEAGDIRHGKTVTAAGEGATESATRGCKPSSTDGTGTDVALFPRWTASMTTAASATATYPTRLDRRGPLRSWSITLGMTHAHGNFGMRR